MLGSFTYGGDNDEFTQRRQKKGRMRKMSLHYYKVVVAL